MIDETDKAFERRLRDMMANAEDVPVPPLTPERLASLRALIPGAPAAVPFLSLAWQRVADGTREVLTVLRAVGATVANAPAPLVRDGGGEGSRIDMIACPLAGGELKARVIPLENRKAKLVLSVKGGYGKRGCLSVELSRDRRLVEARPLEQKAEVTLDGVGSFTVTLIAGDEVVGEMNLDIGEVR